MSAPGRQLLASALGGRLLGKFGAAAALRLFGAGMQFAMGVAVARLTGIHGTGVFYIGFSIVALLAVVSRLGMEFSIVRSVAGHAHAQDLPALDERVASSLALALAISLGFAIGIWLAADLIAQRLYDLPEAAAAIGMIAFALPFTALTGLFSEMLKGLDRPLAGTVVQTCVMPTAACAGIGLLGLLGLSGPEHAAAAVSAGAALATAVGLLLWLQARRTVGPWSKFKLGSIGAIAREAPTLMMVSLATVIMQWIGSVILGLTSTPEEVGGFTTAMRSSIGVSLLLAAAASVVASRLAVQARSADPAELKETAQNTSRMLALTGWPVVGVLLFLPNLVMMLFGPEFRPFADLLRVLAVGQLVGLFIGHAGYILMMAGRDQEARMTAVIALATSLLLNLALIPWLGALGAAVAASAAIAAGHLSSAWFVWRRFHFVPIWPFWRPLVRSFSRET